MAGSVAGKIRIDLLANAAQYNAGMKQAGREGATGFRQEFERTVKGFNSKKAIEERSSNQLVSWYKAMHDDKAGPLFNYAYSAQGEKIDQALRNEVKIRSSLPWGNTLRTTMSAEAAATAAAIGSHKQELVHRLKDATKEIAGEAANAGGLGSLWGVAQKMNAHPFVAVAGAGIGFAIERMRERQQLALDVGRESRMIGQSAEDTSTLKALGFDPGMLVKFQKAIADQGPEIQEAFKKLRLNPDEIGTKPLLEAMKELGPAFDRNVKNSADRSSVALHLFGKSGSEVLPILAGIKQRMEMINEHKIIKAEDVENAKAIDNALSQTMRHVDEGLGKLTGHAGESGFKNLARGLEATVGFVTGADMNKVMGRWEREDARSATAGERERKRTQQERLTAEHEKHESAAKKAAEAMGKLNEQLIGMRYGEEALDRFKFSKDLEKQGMFESPVKNVSEKEKIGAENTMREAKEKLNRAFAHQVATELHGGDASKAREDVAAAKAEVKEAEADMRRLRDRQKAAERSRMISGNPYEIVGQMRSAGASEGSISSYLATRGAPGDAIMRQYDEASAEKARRKQEEESQRGFRERVSRVESDARSEDPEEKLRENIANLNDLWARGEIERGRTREDASRIYWSAEQKYMTDYFRDASDFDVKAARKKAESPSEWRAKQLGAIAAAEAHGDFRDRPELAGRAREDTQREFLKRQGVRADEFDYARSFRDLSESYSRGDFGRPGTQEADQAFSRRRKELRREATGGMTKDYQETHATPAMQAGSSEAHKTIVDSMLGGQRDELQRQANRTLDAIEKHLRPGGSPSQPDKGTRGNQERPFDPMRARDDLLPSRPPRPEIDPTAPMIGGVPWGGYLDPGAERLPGQPKERGDASPDRAIRDETDRGVASRSRELVATPADANRDQLQQQTNIKLDRIEQHLASIAGNTKSSGQSLEVWN